MKQVKRKAAPNNKQAVCTKSDIKVTGSSRLCAILPIPTSLASVNIGIKYKIVIYNIAFHIVTLLPVIPAKKRGNDFDCLYASSRRAAGIAALLL